MPYYYILLALICLVIYILSKIQLLLYFRNISPRSYLYHWLNPALGRYADENKRLASLWRESKTQPFVFVAVDVHAWDEDRG